jgi:SAM-dependent methyltransferase
MYEFLKNLFPKALIKKNESTLRKILSVLYIGKRFQCTVCDFEMSRFITSKKGDKLCPKCGSLSRTRRLWVLLKPKLNKTKILHFSPSKSIRTRLASLTNITYITTDYAGEFEAMKCLNIEAIDEPDNQYDIIICYHVLEHIENDQKAMQELYRITKLVEFVLFKHLLKREKFMKTVLSELNKKDYSILAKKIMFEFTPLKV